MHAKRIIFLAVLLLSFGHSVTAEDDNARAKPPRYYGFAFNYDVGRETMILKVSDVRAASPAAGAHLRTGDRIIAIDGRSDFKSIREVSAYVTAKPSGERLRLQVVRDEASMLIVMRAAEQRYSKLLR